MIKARVQSGEIVVIEKDCQCHTHDGPHWLHRSDLAKRLNEPLRKRVMEMTAAVLDRTISFENAHVYPALVRVLSEKELERLKELRREMETRGIVEIITEED